jgi:hypothetical protein
MRFKCIEEAFKRWRDAMPDFEIRYFDADGKLAVIVITTQPNEAVALQQAAKNLGTHTRFEVHLAGAGHAP